MWGPCGARFPNQTRSQNFKGCWHGSTLMSIEIESFAETSHIFSLSKSAVNTNQARL